MTSRPIDAKEAKELMDTRVQILNQLDDGLKKLAMIEEVLENRANGTDEKLKHRKSQNHLDSLTSRKNCFVFFREDIERFFAHDSCTHLLVILAAKNIDIAGEKPRMGDQTVILVGCERVESESGADDTATYKSVVQKAGQEATQHPDFETIVDFPPASSDPSESTLKFIINKK